MNTNPSSAIVADYLVASLMLSGPIRDPTTEARLTERRRKALFEPTEATVLAHLAVQGFLNEFCWRETEAETERVAALAATGKRDAGTLLRLACYRPLSDLRDAASLRGDGLVGEVLRVHVADVLAERRLRDEIAPLTRIREGLSQVVQAMYEENPYPRWSQLGSPSKPPLALQAGADVLVAGCGSGRHAIGTARRDPTSAVLAVDLSRSSLAYAMRKASDAGVDNIAFGQADLLELPSLGRTFDVVECVGTLQCMESPAEGLAALTRMLRPGGVLRLGLYSAAARASLRPAQQLGKSYPATPEGIRAFRQRIMSAPPGDPLRAAMAFPDFYSASTTRDLLLHVKEHVHTLPQVEELLAGAGLEFIALEPPPGAPDQGSLAAWDAYEASHPDSFRRMYQIWARKP